MTRYAVVIGTNYDGAAYQLSGCVNDALDWASLLGGAGYSVKTLIGHEATGDNILGALADVVAMARWGDRVVITYSGHGTWVPDRDGDEIDRRDEAWCPDDFQVAGVLTDDLLSEILFRARVGVGRLLLSDSCYSGTMQRLLHDEQRDRIRFLPPAFISRSGDLLRDGEREVQIASTTRTYTQGSSLISGCGEDEVSYDAWFGERANGAFTRVAIDAYVPGQSLTAWYAAIRTKLPSTDYPQTPQLQPANWYRRYARAL